MRRILAVLLAAWQPAAAQPRLEARGAAAGQQVRVLPVAALAGGRGTYGSSPLRVVPLNEHLLANANARIQFLIGRSHGGSASSAQAQTLAAVAFAERTPAAAVVRAAEVETLAQPRLREYSRQALSAVASLQAQASGELGRGNASRDALPALRRLAKDSSSALANRFWDGARAPGLGPAGSVSGIWARPRTWLGARRDNGILRADGPPSVQTEKAPNERSLAWLAFAWNFLTISVFYMLSPLRSGILLAHMGPQALPWVYMLSALVTGAAVWVYTRFADLPRSRFIPGAIAALSSSILAWAGLVALVGTATPWLGFALYIWVDVFAIMSVTLLWTYMNDVFSSQSAKRFFGFGFIAVAGSLGAIVGSLFIKGWVRAIGPGWALLVAAVVYAASLLVFALMERLGKGALLGDRHDLSQGRDLGKLFEAFKAVLSSRFLALLTLVVALERFVPDLADYIFGAVAQQLYPDEKDLTVFSATFSLWESITAVAVGTLLSSLVLKKLGVKGALVSGPMANFLGFLAFLLNPVLAVVVIHNAMDGVLRHTIIKAGKETTYTVADRNVIYKVKAYIEMFVYRFSRGLAGLAILGMTALLGFGPAGVAVFGVLAAALWAYVSWKLGTEFKAREAGDPPFSRPGESN